MRWNHRVIARTDGDEVLYGIHEVHYISDDSDEDVMWTENPVRVVGSSVEGLRETLQRMLDCLDKPILDTGDEE